MNMRLLGARTIEEVTEDMVDARAVGWHDGGGVPQDHMFTSNCASASSLPLRDAQLLTRLCFSRRTSFARQPQGETLRSSGRGEGYADVESISGL